MSTVGPTRIVARTPLVLFAVAAGPEIGFGASHPGRSTADALDVRRHLVVRGPESALLTALAFGWHVHRGAHLLRALDPDLVVVDDASTLEQRRWILAARAARVPVAVVLDGGAATTGADLTIDGSLAAAPRVSAKRIAGPAFAILKHASVTRRAVTSRDRQRVLIALGGGAHVRRMGVAIAGELATRCPKVRVDIARGFTTGQLPALAAGCRWIHAPDGLGAQLAMVGAAVVAGGVTLAEACASGTPVVAVPVVGAQRPAIAAAKKAGAILTTGSGRPRLRARDVATAVATLLGERPYAEALGRRARALVDGRGAARVAVRIRALLGASQERRWRHAA